MFVHRFDFLLVDHIFAQARPKYRKWQPKTYKQGKDNKQIFGSWLISRVVVLFSLMCLISVANWFVVRM